MLILAIKAFAHKVQFIKCFRYSKLVAFTTIQLCCFLVFLAMGQRVETFDSKNITGILLYDYNPYVNSFAGVSRDGTLLLITPEGERVLTIRTAGLQAVEVVSSNHILLQRDSSLELLSMDGSLRVVCACQDLRILNVYEDYVLIECNRSIYLVDIFDGKTIKLEYYVRPLNTWKHAAIFDFSRSTILIFTGRELVHPRYDSKGVDLAFSIEGERGIYLVFANGTVALLDPILASVKRLSNVKLSPPIAVVQVGGREHIVLRDGTLIDERGRKSEVRFNLAYVVANRGLFAVTEDRKIFFRKTDADEWIGPLSELSKEVIAVIPLTYFVEVPAVRVVCRTERGVEMFTVGYKDYEAVAKLGDTRVYAGESIDVIVEADREGVLSGIVRVSKEDRTVIEQKFSSPKRSAMIHLRVDEPGDYDVYVEIDPRLYYPSKRVPAGRLHVLPRPIRCWLHALESEIVEGGEVTLKLQVIDALNSDDLVRTGSLPPTGITVRHVLPNGQVEERVYPLSDVIRLRLRGLGNHQITVLLPASGKYFGCTTNWVTVGTRAGIDVIVLFAMVGTLVLIGGATFFYVRYQSNIWRGIERAVTAGASCEELITKLSGVVPEEKVLAACSFVNRYKIAAEGINQLLSVVKVSSTPDVRNMIRELEMSKEKINDCKTIYLKGDPKTALDKLNELNSTITPLLLNLKTVLEGERLQISNEYEKFREYLDKLEMYKDKTRPEVYQRLKSMYEAEYQRTRERKEQVDNALITIERMLKT